MKSKLQKKAWWSFNFTMPHEEDPPDLSMDVMLAHAVVKPVLDEYQEKINLWRFHRRSADDIYRHKFAFIFYCKKDLAKRIVANFESDLVLKSIVLKKLVEDTFPSKIEDSDIDEEIRDTADPNWPVPIKRSWPYFAMGLSQAWLDLIDSITFGKIALDLTNPEKTYNRYKDVDEEVTKIWQTQGQHIFFHHVSAMFGYEKLWIQKMVQF